MRSMVRAHGCTTIEDPRQEPEPGETSSSFWKVGMGSVVAQGSSEGSEVQFWGESTQTSQSVV